jgi:RNA polymerase sigma factor (sigma-70 family)
MLLAGSQADAEDLVQDALVATFSGRARFATAAEAEAYVRRGIASRFVDHGRRRTAERGALVKAGGRRAPLPDDVTASGLAPEVERALGQLSPRVRACIVLRHMDDLSVRETAQLLRLSEGAVKRYVSDGVAALGLALGATSSGRLEPVVQVPGAVPRRSAIPRKEGRRDA